jgi:hypothetical protein
MTRNRLQTAWEGVTEAIVRMGRKVDEITLDSEAVDRVEGHRFVARILAAMMEFLLEQDPDRPSFVRIMTPTRKFYLDNPDTIYHHASLSPKQRYRVWGHRGSCEYLSFCVYGQREGQTYISCDASDRDLTFCEDGRFEIFLSSEEPAGPANWMKLDPRCRSLVVRQYFLDRDAESPAEFHIEVLRDQPLRPSPARPDAMAARLRALAGALDRTMDVTIEASQKCAKHPNTITIDGSADNVVSLYPTKDNQYLGGWYRLDDGEALLIEGTPPDCRYWSVHLANRWLESLDYRYHQVTLNKRQIQLEADGRFMIVVADQDPGVGNWLDTCGHREGIALFRWLQADDAPPQPQVRVVRLDDLMP